MFSRSLSDNDHANVKDNDFTSSNHYDTTTVQGRAAVGRLLSSVPATSVIINPSNHKAVQAVPENRVPAIVITRDRNRHHVDVSMNTAKHIERTQKCVRQASVSAFVDIMAEVYARNKIIPSVDFPRWREMDKMNKTSWVDEVDQELPLPPEKPTIRRERQPPTESPPSISSDTTQSQPSCSDTTLTKSRTTEPLERRTKKIGRGSRERRTQAFLEKKRREQLLFGPIEEQPPQDHDVNTASDETEDAKSIFVLSPVNSFDYSECRVSWPYNDQSILGHFFKKPLIMQKIQELFLAGFFRHTIFRAWQ